MDTEDYVLNFEAVKTSFRQTKDGYHLTLVIHPSDVPQELFSSWVGTRYQCSIAELSDENEPVMREGAKEVDAIVQQAGMLCRSVRFQTWISHTFSDENLSLNDCSDEEEAAARLLCHLCGISSRAELRKNSSSRTHFSNIYEKYEDYILKGTD
tara:strand:+ start:152 stop:613 length:462 start_codon:yes stop_codon:yes gene_type:complete